MWARYCAVTPMTGMKSLSSRNFSELPQARYGKNCLTKALCLVAFSFESSGRWGGIMLIHRFLFKKVAGESNALVLMESPLFLPCSCLLRLCPLHLLTTLSQLSQSLLSLLLAKDSPASWTPCCPIALPISCLLLFLCSFIQITFYLIYSLCSRYLFPSFNRCVQACQVHS